MSDTRYALIGIGLIFSGFIIFGIFGSQYFVSTIEVEEFGECYEYLDASPPIPVDCEIKIQNKSIFFVLIAALIGGGIGALVKGVKGRWDQDVKPEDMVGPGGPTRSNSDKSD